MEMIIMATDNKPVILQVFEMLGGEICGLFVSTVDELLFDLNDKMR
jgi:hypothetical protein